MAANASDMFQKVARSTATTLSAPGYTVGATSINVASTSNWPADTGITFGIDEVDGNGNRIAGTYNIFRGTVGSATQLANLTYVGGDANRNYSAGATTRVYILVSYARENRLVDGLLVSHDQDGTLKTDSVDSTQIKANAITTPKIADGAVTADKTLFSPYYKPLQQVKGLFDTSSTSAQTADTFNTGIDLTGESVTVEARVECYAGNTTTGANVAQVAPSISIDGGTTWSDGTFQQCNVGNSVGSSYRSAISSTHVYSGVPSGVIHVRVRSLVQDTSVDINQIVTTVRVYPY